MSPINVPGCIGIRMTGVGTQDEGLYTCTVHNAEGSADSTTILLVDCEFILLAQLLFFLVIF